jgi:hypothetical protein
MRQRRNGVSVWNNKSTHIGEDDIFGMLRDIRQGEGMSSQILRHSRRAFALLGAATREEALKILKEATEIAPGDKHLRAAANALNLEGEPTTLTQRRNKLIKEALAQPKVVRDREKFPTTISGLLNWEDQGLQRMAAHLFQRLPAEDPVVAIGQLNARVFALEAALQRERQLAQFRDERLQAALSETADILVSLINNRDYQESADEAALLRLSALQTLYLGTTGRIRQLDLSGHPSSGLFEESLATQSIAQVRADQIFNPDLF